MIIQLLEFIFGSFWRWAGTVVLIIALGVAVPSLITIRHVRGDEE